MKSAPTPGRGRGTGLNPSGRFLARRYGSSLEVAGSEEAPLVVSPRTQVFEDATRSVVTHNDSPDVGIEASINPYRGCEHGCVYCYARPTHEYLDLSAGEDFESKIFVKSRAAELLRKKMMSRSWQPQVITRVESPTHTSLSSEPGW